MLPFLWCFEVPWLVSCKCTQYKTTAKHATERIGINTAACPTLNITQSKYRLSCQMTLKSGSFTTRVVSSEISLGKFLEIYSNLCGNLLNNFFHLIIFNYHHIKMLKIRMFLTNNSPDLCVSTLHINFRKNNVFHRINFISLLFHFHPRISANSNENCRRSNFQALPNISGKFPELLNFRKIYNPTCFTLCEIKNCGTATMRSRHVILHLYWFLYISGTSFYLFCQYFIVLTLFLLIHI